MITFNKVIKKFGEKIAVNNLDMEIKTGEITMLIGPSGCGKTTTLKMINRLIDVTDGTILIKGESIYALDVVQLRRKIGYVIQEVGLFPHMNVYDNIAIVPRLLKWQESVIQKRVEELLDLVTLNTSYMYKYPLQLSGGERQRVGLARALAADPEILLMDEPFGAIDPINRAKLHDSFLSIQEQIQKTIVFVTHDINEAIKLGDRIAIIKQGNLVQYDTVETILYEPANEFVEKLLGHDRNIKALVLKKNRDYIKKTGYVTCLENETPEKIIKKMQDNQVQLSIILGAQGTFRGLYILEQRKRSGQFHLVTVEDPITVEQNSNLQETFSKMMAAGESSLPVVTDKNRFEGFVHLADIFKSFQTV